VKEKSYYNQEIRLYEPKSNIAFGLFVAILCLGLGVLFPFLGKWQPLSIGGSLIFIGASLLTCLFCIKLLRSPTLIINAEGIHSLKPALRMEIKWEEIDAIYRINAKFSPGFAVDLSPAGLLSFFTRQGKAPPRVLDTSVPQLALGIPQSNLPVPVDHLLSQIQEQFAEQIASYHIDVDDGREES
jgi:hypothetical protein